MIKLFSVVKKKAGVEKRKMQNVSFRSVAEFLDFLPPDELEIVEYLRAMILEIIPDCQEKLSYNVPYYRRHGNICFIWPGAVSWGSVRQQGVRLGFTKGYLMQDEINYLDKGGRKQVYWKDFYSLSDIDEELLRAYLFEALSIDEYSHKNQGSQSI